MSNDDNIWNDRPWIYIGCISLFICSLWFFENIHREYDHMKWRIKFLESEVRKNREK